MKKLVITALVTVGMTAGLIQGPAVAGQCYWGSDGVLVVPDDGQCTILIDPIRPIPTGTSTPEETSTPTTSETRSPNPFASIRPSAVGEIRVAQSSSHILGETIRQISITNLDDPNESTACFNATFCSIKIPVGSRYLVSAFSTDLVALSGGSASCKYNRVFGNHVATCEGIAGDYQSFSVGHASLVQGMSISGSQTKLLDFDYSAQGGAVIEEGIKKFFLTDKLRYTQGDLITGVETWINEKNIVWTGLPQGVKPRSGGGFTGVFEKPGKYKLEGRVGYEGTQNFYLRIEIEVTPLVLPPKVTGTVAIDPTTQELRLNAPILEGKEFAPDYYRIVLKNESTGVSSTKFFDGDAKSGTFTLLDPGTIYSGTIVSCLAASGLCSSDAENFKFTSKNLPWTPRAAKKSGGVTASWVSGSANSINVTVSGVARRTVTIKTTNSLTASQINEIRSRTKWEVTKNGEIIVPISVKGYSLREVQVGSFFINFTILPGRR